MMHGLQFLLEPSGSVAHMSGLICLEIAQSIALEDGLFACSSSESLCKLANKLGSI